MQIRILSDDLEELWAKSENTNPRIPSSPREKVFERIITGFESAMQNYAKLTQTAPDARPIVVLVSDEYIEVEMWRGEDTTIKIELSYLPKHDIHELRFRLTSTWETVDLQACT